MSRTAASICFFWLAVALTEMVEARLSSAFFFHLAG